MKLFWRIYRDGSATGWRYSADYELDGLSWIVWCRFCHDPDLRLNWGPNNGTKLEMGTGPNQDEVTALQVDDIRRLFIGEEGRQKALLKSMGIV